MVHSTTAFTIGAALLSAFSMPVSAQTNSTRNPVPITIGQLGIPHGYLMLACTSFPLFPPLTVIISGI